MFPSSGPAAAGQAPSARVALRAGTVALLLALGACATVDPQPGPEVIKAVDALVQPRTGVAPARADVPRDARVAALLAQPLTADAAVEVALLNQPRVLSALQELRVAAADRARAGTLPNPRFGFTDIAGGGIREIERSVVVDVMAILAMPLATDLEQRRYEQTQVRVAAAIVAMATTTRKAWVDAVAAAERERNARQVEEAASIAAELARRMAAAGNVPTLTALREEAAFASARSAATQATQQSVEARETLVRALGLASADAVKLPPTLPPVPAQLEAKRAVEQTAMDQRLDVLYAKRALETSAYALSLTRTTRFVNLLDVGYANKSQSGLPRENGYVIEVEVPLFDLGTSRIAQADARYRQAELRAAEVSVDALSAVRAAWAGYAGAHANARRSADGVLPLRDKIVDEVTLRYNAMLASAFDLMVDVRERIAAQGADVEARREFWIADATLQAAMAGGEPDARIDAQAH